MTPSQAYEILQQLQGTTAEIRALAQACIKEQEDARARGHYLPIQEAPSYESWRHARRAQDKLRSVYRV